MPSFRNEASSLCTRAGGDHKSTPLLVLSIVSATRSKSSSVASSLRVKVYSVHSYSMQSSIFDGPPYGFEPGILRLRQGRGSWIFHEHFQTLHLVPGARFSAPLRRADAASLEEPARCALVIVLELNESTVLQTFAREIVVYKVVVRHRITTVSSSLSHDFDLRETVSTTEVAWFALLLPARFVALPGCDGSAGIGTAVRWQLTEHLIAQAPDDEHRHEHTDAGW